MNKVFASALLTAAVLASQALADNITMNDGQTVENATVLKVGVREIEYKVGKRKVLYTVRKADVAKIAYKDGSVDLFPLKEKRKGDGWKGDGFRKPRWGKGPGPGVGPDGACHGYGGEPGDFRKRERFGDDSDRDWSPPPDRSYDGPRGDRPPRMRQRDGKPVGQPGRDNEGPQPQEPALAPPPPPQGHTVTPPPPPQGHTVTPPPPPQGHAVTPPPAPAQPAKTQPAATAPATPAPATPATPAQPAATQPAKTQPAATPAPAAPAQPTATQPAKTQPAAAPAPATQPATTTPAR